MTDWPSYDAEEIEAVLETLKSGKVNYWTGENCVTFEKEFAEFVGVSYAVAVSNGTTALHLAFEALGVGPGDEVVVSPRTYFASVSSIVVRGAIPVFADVDLDTQNITAETINKVLSPRTKAIVCVHLAGWPCDMDSIIEVAEMHNLFVVEDCAQAHGSKYKGRSVGSMGHIGAWSFCQDKIMTTGGEGGMVTTNDRELWSRMWSYKDHGKSWGTVYEREHPPGFRWLHESFGSNYRMTEMQAAIGRAQLKKMPEWNARRRANALEIWNVARELAGLRAPEFKCESCPDYCKYASECVHAAYKCYVFVEAGEQARDVLIQKINGRGVPCISGSCPEVYLEKAFDDTGLRPNKRLPNAKLLGETSLMFPCHPTLTEQEIQFTCSVLRACVSELYL